MRECIRFRYATKVIRAAQRKAPGQTVSQLVLVGEEFTPEAARSRSPALGKPPSLLLKGVGPAHAHVMTHEPTASSGEQTATVVLTLPLHFEVILDKEADRKFVRLIHGGAIKRDLAMFWMRNLLGYAGLVLGIYSSLISEMVLTACIISTLGM